MTAGLGVAAAVLTPSLLGCATPEASDTVRREVQRTLDARAAAVLDHDEHAYLSHLAPEVVGLYVEERRQFRNLADVPLRSWSYRVVEMDGEGERVTADVELRYRLTGYDYAPVTSRRQVRLDKRHERWWVTADEPAQGSAQQLWQQGRVRAVHGKRSLVMGVDQGVERLKALADRADRAVPAVSDAWPSPWPRRVVVLAPASVEAMGALLGAPAAGYRGIAAVTTGETGRTGAVPADRILVNPSAYTVLSEFGQDAVLTHETAHVATRAYTSQATPMWLSEGFADWVAYRGTGRTASQTAPELQRAVRRGAVPAGLPLDGDFSFGADADGLARAYEGGWLACELIAERWGERKLTEFYRAVGAGRTRAGAVERAVVEQFGTTLKEFTEEWRDYLRERLGG
ncbi:hypothetical protein [Streptomyces sp. NBC_00690]|uniref:hypothetical protein n=1 Tax=Streptomyces sp. NBC_00690 TaxID=2975808 RepID=UPI002E2D5C97|nr:hypothetical protein [Streptomyces sp. NBC_00690]